MSTTNKWWCSRLSWGLVAFHSALVLLLAFLTGTGRLSDQDATFLVPTVLELIDYPLLFVLAPVAKMTDQWGSYLVLLVFGGVYWFVIGTIARTLICWLKSSGPQQ